MKPEITFEMLTTDQLKTMLRIRAGECVEYELWDELFKLGLVDIMPGEGEVLVQDILTDRALEILGVLTK